jgi:hypothetical protein
MLRRGDAATWRCCACRGAKIVRLIQVMTSCEQLEHLLALRRLQATANFRDNRTAQRRLVRRQRVVD